MITLICITCFFTGWNLAKWWYQSEVIDYVEDDIDQMKYGSPYIFDEADIYKN